MKDYNIEEIINSLDFEKNSIHEIGNHIYLTNFEISVLDKYHIDYKNAISLKEILFLVENNLNEDSSLEDLEEVSKTIAERDYYLNTNK